MLCYAFLFSGFKLLLNSFYFSVLSHIYYYATLFGSIDRPGLIVDAMLMPLR